MNRYFFGDDWHAPVTEASEQVPTPLGETCGFCEEVIIEGDQGTFIPSMLAPTVWSQMPVHRECMLREVLGPCGADPSLSRRASALWVWEWVKDNDIRIGGPQ